uniref:Cytochrom p450 reductase n=1 Tax=Croton stellatopilosus TaxID=431156 RepID=A0A0A7DLM4_9ROSI|nr:cytochrome p450 [Croton stellatopilosus]CDM63950.1 cytochrom p450 reductase [Croton stellatopilosus]
MEFSVASALITFLLTIALIQAIILISKRNKRTSSCNFKLPPGPKPLPFLGNLLELGDKPHKSLANLAKIYGPLMTLKLGQITTIVISSANLAKQVLLTLDPSFCNRNVVEAIQAREHHQVSVVWLPVGAPWRNLRKICNSYIFSNQKLDSNQELRRKKIQDLVDQVEASCRLGAAVDIGELAFKASLNVLSTSVFSLDLSDSKSDIVREFKEVVRCVMDEVGKPNLADYFPILRKIDPQRRKQRVDIQFGVLFEIFDRIIDKRLLLRKQPGYIPANDVLDTLLSLSEDDNSEGLDLNCIKHLFFDLFVAGTDTTSSTLEWALAELLKNPKTLIKAQAEIEQTIGKGKLIQESDVVKLPYLQAVIKETFRLHPAVPFLLPRKAGEHVEIGGFTVPKDAQVLVNAWAIGRDPSLWEDADLFIPERFLGSDIDARGRNFELIPFGAGRRICPGLPLAIRMLHLMLGSLINLFDWKLESGINPNVMNMEDRFGITLQKANPLLAVPLKLQH